MANEGPHVGAVLRERTLASVTWLIIPLAAWLLFSAFQSLDSGYSILAVVRVLGAIPAATALLFLGMRLGWSTGVRAAILVVSLLAAAVLSATALGPRMSTGAILIAAVVLAAVFFGVRVMAAVAAVVVVAFMAIAVWAHGGGATFPYQTDLSQLGAWIGPLAVIVLLGAMLGVAVARLLAGYETSIRDARAATEVFERIFAVSPDVLTVTRVADQILVDVNPAFEVVLGHRRDDAIGRTAVALGIWPDPARRAELTARIERGEVIDAAPVQARRKDGELLDGLMSVRRVVLGGTPVALATFRDVSASARARAALEASEARLRSFGEAAFEGVVVSRDGRLLDFNDQFREMFGHDADELRGRPIVELIDPEHVETVRHAIANNRVEPYEVVARRKDGTAIDVEIRARTVRTDGNVLRITAVRDVTARNRAARTLRDNEARLRAITQHTPALILEVDRAGRVLYQNRRGDGVDAATPAPASLEEIRFESDHRTLLRQQIEHVLDGGVEVATELRLHASRGGLRTFAAVMGPIAVAGQPDRVVITAIDVTEQRRAEAAAREQEERLVAVAAQVPGVLYQLRRHDSGDTFTYVSPQTERVLGIAIGTAPGDPARVFERIHPDDRADVSASYAESARTMEPRRQVFRIERAGATAWIEDVGVPQRRPEGVLWSGYLHDITDRRLAEDQQLRLIGELTAKNAEMEQFTYTVSHDLKSPIVTVAGFVGLIRDDLGRGDLDAARTDLDRIASAAGKMTRLLDDLLEMSRVGRIAGDTAAVPLGEVVADAAELLAAQLGARAVELVVAPDLPVVHGDRVRLLQVMQNLIENAIKHVGAQSAPRIDIGVRPDPAMPVCTVRDNGAGIEPQHAERVFRLFEKLDPRTAGSGVGLTLVRRIVEFHGGRVWIESAGAGQGTTVCVALPTGAPGPRD